TYPWQHRIDAPVEVVLSLRGDLAPLAGRIFPDAKVDSKAGESTAVVVATFLDGLLRYVLSLGGDCRVVRPPPAGSRWRQKADKVRDAPAPRPWRPKVARGVTYESGFAGCSSSCPSPPGTRESPSASWRRLWA